MSTMAMFLNISEDGLVPALRDTAATFDGGPGEAALDFSSVQRITAGGLKALEDLARIADDKGVRVVIRGVNVDVYKVLKLVKLTSRFSFVN